MPQLLQDFELARGRRLWDGVGLWHLGHDHGSVYLLGYHAEMTLKSAYFTAIGFLPNAVVEHPQLNTALARANALAVATPHRGFHSIRFWADLLVADRAARGQPLAVNTSADLALHAAAVEARWNVEMRYVASATTRANLEVVVASVDWIDRHYTTLAR